MKLGKTIKIFITFSDLNAKIISTKIVYDLFRIEILPFKKPTPKTNICATHYALASNI